MHYRGPLDPWLDHQVARWCEPIQGYGFTLGIKNTCYALEHVTPPYTFLLIYVTICIGFCRLSAHEYTGALRLCMRFSFSAVDILPVLPVQPVHFFNSCSVLGQLHF